MVVTQMELKLGVVGRDPCKCKGSVVGPHRNHRLVWKNGEREGAVACEVGNWEGISLWAHESHANILLQVQGKPWKGAADGAETDGTFPP